MENLCQYKTGCFGCCGFRFGAKEVIFSAVVQHNSEFEEILDKEAFRDRADTWDLNHGLCRNFGKLKNGTHGCLIYPKEGEADHRRGHCDIGYECQPLKTFLSWPKDKQAKFQAFLEEKDLDLYDYSTGMFNGSLLKEFIHHIK